MGKPWSATAGPERATERGDEPALFGMQCDPALARPQSRLGNAAVPDVQAGNEAGGNVRKGEHGTKVYFVKQLQIKDGDGEEADTRLVPMLREYTVFNVDQCEDLPDSVKAGKPMRVRNPDTRDALADEFLRSTGADIREGHGEAYYVPSQISFRCRLSRRSRARITSTTWRSMS